MMNLISIACFLVTGLIISPVHLMPTKTECRDISTRCSKYLQYCGIREFVTERCQKSCGFCGTNVVANLPPQVKTSTTNPTPTPSTTTTTTTTTTKTTSTPTTRTPSELEDECLTIHWHFRMLHKNTPKLKWNNDLQEGAQQWADHLAETGQFEKSTNRINVGENIFQYDSLDQRLEGKCLLAVYFWYAEAFFYNFETQTSTGETGNYTQMIWRDTREVGFGLARNGNRFVVVAHYFPAGNIPGRFKENVNPPIFTGVRLE